MPRRLFIAFLCSAALALVCWLILPLIGVWAPWWLPLLIFAVIAVSTILSGFEWNPTDPDEGPLTTDLHLNDEEED
jgi:hypothetical protein